MSELIPPLEFVIAAVAAVWGIYQTFVIHRLNQQVHRLNIELDQSIQRLYRALEALMESGWEIRDELLKAHYGIDPEG